MCRVCLYYWYCFSFIFLFSCSDGSSNHGGELEISKPQLTIEGKGNSNLQDSLLKIRIIDAPNRSFGYDILKNGKLLIHQPHIPGASGVNGFSSKEKAIKAAELIITKLNNNIMPPTVTIQELDSIGSLN